MIPKEIQDYLNKYDMTLLELMELTYKSMFHRAYIFPVLYQEEKENNPEKKCIELKNHIADICGISVYTLNSYLKKK